MSSTTRLRRSSRTGPPVADVRFLQATRIYPGSEAPAVDALDLHVADGEFMVLVGPSGSGKTTALRMLAGLEEVDSGAVYIGERDVTYVPPKNRDVSMVFQNYALYPYMTVAQNIGFPLKIAKVKKDVRDERVRDVAQMLGLEHYLERKPGQLSGGERQRVAMGRAIVRVPSVFLMDEPLSNLDAQLRVQMRADVAALQLEFGVTTVYVTHDQAEAMTLGHRVAVLRDGKLQQCGPPRELYDRPTNTFVAGFIGSPTMNLCPVQLGTNGAIALGAANVAIDDALAGVARSNGRGDLVLGLRPESLEVGQNGVPARVEIVEELGADAYVFCVAEIGGEELKLVARTKARDVPAARRPGRAQPAAERGAPLRLGHRRAAGADVTAHGETFLAEIRDQPQALLRLVEQAPVYEEAARAAIERGPHIVRLVGHGSSDNAASYGVYAFGLEPGWTALRDSISLSVYYGAKIDLERSIVVALSQSGRTPDVVAYVERAKERGALTIGVTNETDSELARRSRSDASAGRWARARSRRLEDVREPARGAPAAGGRGRGPNERDRRPDRPGSRVHGRGAPRLRGRRRLRRRRVRIRWPHVRDRPRNRVRHGARDRAQADRDLPRRRRAADRRPTWRTARSPHSIRCSPSGRSPRRTRRCRRSSRPPGERATPERRWSPAATRTRRSTAPRTVSPCPTAPSTAPFATALRRPRPALRRRARLGEGARLGSSGRPDEGHTGSVMQVALTFDTEFPGRPTRPAARTASSRRSPPSRNPRIVLPPGPLDAREPGARRGGSPRPGT